MNKALRDRDYLEHIEAAIGKIQRFLQDEARFVDDDLLQDAVIHDHRKQLVAAQGGILEECHNSRNTVPPTLC